MPFLRVIRDKRGYETTYLMHWYREGNRQHSRILYVFRSPGEVRVGRDPLEPEILREIEACHPDIAFDWKVVRENQQVVDSPHEMRRRRPSRQEESGDVPTAPVAAPAVPTEEPAPPRPAIPAKIEGGTPAEQITFLTSIYAVLRERIPQRTNDPERLEALLALAERLNPAAWTDADQITTGLEDAAEALDRLAHVFAKRRRRGRRKPRGAESPTVTDATVGVDDATIVAGDAAAVDETEEPAPSAAADSEEPPDSEENSAL